MATLLEFRRVLFRSRVDTVTLTIDGIEVQAAKGELVIRVAERLGIAIPRFCDHPLLAPAGACRQCLVEVEGQRKPVASCTQTVSDGMVVRTQLTSDVAKKAQAGIMEFLLINHPLDCPMCDKGGECPLQNQAMSNGRADTRFHDEIAGDPFIDLMDRSAGEQINIFPGDPFQSYFSGNTVQICPVGALTGAQYRFRSRPFDLVSTPSGCEHCAAGCDMRTDWRRGKVLRRLAGDDPAVNEEWNCDKGRWGFQYATAFDRITTPMVKDETTGVLREASWPEALSRAEETAFLAAHVVGVTGVTYADVEAAPAVVLVGLEPEEECPILFLRLRKAYIKRRMPVYAVAPFASPGLTKLGATIRPVVPGGEAALLADERRLAGLAQVPAHDDDALRTALGAEGALLIVGERLATVPGGLSAAAALAADTGARLAWVPRRAGDRGAIEVGCLPNLLPGGRFVGDPGARAELVDAWGLEAGVLPSKPGRDTDQILAAAADGKLSALVVAGVDPADLLDVRLAEQALDEVGFLVSFELRMSPVARRADVVFPVAPVVEKAGTFLNWEGRLRTFPQVLHTPAISDARALDAVAAELGYDLGCADAETIRAELVSLPATRGTRLAAPVVPPGEQPRPGKGEAVLATWHHLLDLGSLTDGDEYLLGTARAPLARISKATAAELGVAEGDPLTIGTDRGAITLPAALTDLPDGVVWLPTNSPGSTVHRALGVTAGAIVTLTADKRRLDAAPTSYAAGGTR